MGGAEGGAGGAVAEVEGAGEGGWAEERTGEGGAEMTGNGMESLSFEVMDVRESVVLFGVGGRYVWFRGDGMALWELLDALVMVVVT